MTVPMMTARSVLRDPVNFGLPEVLPDDFHFPGVVRRSSWWKIPPLYLVRRGRCLKFHGMRRFPFFSAAFRVFPDHRPLTAEQAKTLPPEIQKEADEDTKTEYYEAQRTTMDSLLIRARVIDSFQRRFSHTPQRAQYAASIC